MKIVKENNKLYVNDLDVEELIANRKYVLRMIDEQLENIKFLMKAKTIDKDKATATIRTLDLVKNWLQLRN